MDVSLVNNVLEGTRQYFMGVPKQAQAEGSGQPVWPAGAPLPEEGAPARSGVPAPTSRPPSAAAAPPSGHSTTPVPTPPRPPSEPLEPEPHIIHKATVMREAAEKRREQPDMEDEEDPGDALSPPSHIIRKPPRTLPSPAPAPAVPCPSPARPPSNAVPSAPEHQAESTLQYRAPAHRVQTPIARPTDHFTPSRPSDPYSTSRPPEPYARFHYEVNSSEGHRNSHGPVASPQPSTHPRHSPQTYARLSSGMPQHGAGRLREVVTQSPPAQRYSMQPVQPPPLPNDRVPPIHHPQSTPPAQRHSSLDSRSPQMYANLQQRREPSPYAQSSSSHYNRHPAVPQRKYDHQQAYPGYRPMQSTQPVQSHRVDTHQVQYKHAALSAHYTTRPQEPHPPQPHDSARLPPRTDYPNLTRPVDPQSNYHYQVPSTSNSRYGPSTPVPVVQNATQHRSVYRTAPKQGYDYPAEAPVQTSTARMTVKPGYPNPTRPTVSVTSLVNEWNQTKQKQDVPTTQVNPLKQKRESPLDLSVKTVKNSADSSTTQDDVVDSATTESKILQLQHRPSSSTRPVHLPTSYGASHKVDFAPNFNQYRDRNSGHNFAAAAQSTSRFNGAYETRRPVESYPPESPHQYHDRNTRTYSIPTRNEPVPKIDLTRSMCDQRHLENATRDDRHILIEERKRPAGPIVSNIPEKILRYETWSSDSRIDHYQAREQLDLMKQPVYSFMGHKQFETYQNEQKRSASSASYREHSSHASHRYQNHVYSHDIRPRESRDPSEYHAHYHEKAQPINNHHHVIKKLPSHRDVHTNHCDPHSGIPVDKSVLSILRKSLETKQPGYVESPRLAKKIPDLIVIDDADDSVIEITDLTKDNESETTVRNAVKSSLNQINSNMNKHIQMPKAVDSLPRDYEYRNSPDPKRKSPENDVASRIRTKAELKVMPPSQDSITKPETKPVENEPLKLLPRKTHLFNQIRKDNLRLESVIKNEGSSEIVIPEVKAEPMNIEEIEKDAEIPIKTENILENLEPPTINLPENDLVDDLNWASACDSFMEQLKSGCHKKKPRKHFSTDDIDIENAEDIKSNIDSTEKREKIDEIEGNVVNNTINSEIVAPDIQDPSIQIQPAIIIKQEPLDEDEIINETLQSQPVDQEQRDLDKQETKIPKIKTKRRESKKNLKDPEKPVKNKSKSKVRSEKTDSVLIKKEPIEQVPLKETIKEESETTDDDEPLIKSKIMKEKKESERLMKFQLLKDLSEKSAYVKLECCDVDVNKNTRSSIDSIIKDREDKPSKGKLSRQASRSKGKLSIDSNKNEKQIDSSSSDSDDDVTVASRLRLRKHFKNDESKRTSVLKTPVKSSPSKKDNSSASNSSTPVRKPTFGDGSCFHPGWEDELYRYKRSLRMPTRLIAIPRGRSGGPFVRGSGALFTRGSTSLPDLDPAPLSPAPSSAPSAATDDLYARRPDKLTLDSDLDSNSSYSAPNAKLHYDSEASTSTVLSTNIKRKGSSIVDVLIQKCGKKENTKKDTKRNKSKDKDDRTPKIIPKKSNDLLPTPSLGLDKNDNKGISNAKKEKVMEGIFYLGAFRKETVTAFRNSFIKDTDGIIGATEEFSAVVLKSRTRTESRVLKQRATIKEVFGDERPASAPPISCREEEPQENKEDKIEIKKEPETPKLKLKPKKIVKDKLNRRSSSIRDGLRSTKSLKRNDAKGRLLRLKKRNSLMVSLNNKRMKGISTAKHKNDTAQATEEKDKVKQESGSLETPEVNTKRRLKRLFGRRKFSSGFDYIRKKKKIIRREDSAHKVRRPAAKPSPESVHDIKKEIKGWFINKSIGETHLHRAARLGYTDCVAYCLEKLEADPSAKDNAGFTPLHVAAANGHVRISRLLLQYGANVSAAAQGGIRPLHEACENCHIEVMRLLLAYGADPLLGTYSGQTPEELTEGPATALLRLHIADVQGLTVEPWKFPPPTEPIDREDLGCDPLSSPPPASPPPPPDATIEIQCTEAPLPPFYSLRTAAGQPSDGLWCLLQDITNLLQIKSKESLLKQIHCGSGSPKELLREIRTQEFLERAQCHQLLCAGEKVNVRASKVALVRVTDKLRQLLKIETALVS